MREGIFPASVALQLLFCEAVVVCIWRTSFKKKEKEKRVFVEVSESGGKVEEDAVLYFFVAALVFLGTLPPYQGVEKPF